MTQVPGYNLYAIRKSAIKSARLDPGAAGLRGVLWYPNELGGWYVASKEGSGWTLLSGPHGDERAALSHASVMTDTGGT